MLQWYQYILLSANIQLISMQTSSQMWQPCNTFSRDQKVLD